MYPASERCSRTKVQQILMQEKEMLLKYLKIVEYFSPWFFAHGSPFFTQYLASLSVHYTAGFSKEFKNDSKCCL